MLTVQQVAQRLNVGPSTVYNLCQKGRLSHVRLGLGRGTIRVSEEDLDIFLKSCRVDGHAAIAALSEENEQVTLPLPDRDQQTG